MARLSKYTHWFSPLLCLMVTGLLGGCLFTPREPGVPVGEEVEWKSPTEPAIVLENITASIEANRLVNYGRSFHEEKIEMEFDAADQSAGDPELFSDWTNVDEELRMRGIMPEEGLTTIELSWDIPDDLFEPNENEAYYENLGYRLVFGQGSKQIVYEGIVELWFFDQNGEWVIHKWLDERKPGSDQHSWGYLRLKNVIEWP